MENWRGEVTDLNIYDSFFEEAELVSWTTSCGVPEKGRILSWEPEDYSLTNNEEIETVISEVASNDLCLIQNKGIDVFEIFDNGQDKSALQAELGCQRLNGQLVMTPTNEKEAHEILRHFREYAIKKNFTGGERSKYLNYRLGGRSDLEGTEFVETEDKRFSFYPKGGKYVVRDPSTDIVLGTQFAAEPSAETYSKPTEMCFYCGWGTTAREISPLEKIVPVMMPCQKDEPCVNFFGCKGRQCALKMNFGYLCKFKEKVRLKLSGLCKDTKVDTDYLLLGYEVLGTEEYTRRIYGGSTGWLLAFDKEQDSWQFRHEYYPHLTLTMEDKDQLPVGLHSWLASNNTCTLGKTTRSFPIYLQILIFITTFSVKLQLSACHANQFTCSNGKCISIDSRCDNREVRSEMFCHKKNGIPLILCSLCLTRPWRRKYSQIKMRVNVLSL